MVHTMLLRIFVFPFILAKPNDHILVIDDTVMVAGKDDKHLVEQYDLRYREAMEELNLEVFSWTLF